MKNLIIVGSLMLGLGIAIGWVAKPVPRYQPAVAAAVSADKKSAAAGEGKSAADPLIQGKRSERDPSPPKKMNRPTDEQMKQAQKMQAEMGKQVVKRYREKFEKQIDKLAASLNLTATQKAALTQWLDEKMATLEALDFSDPKKMSDLTEVGKDLSNKALEAQLESSLTPEQKEALVQFQDKEHRGKVDTMALKSLTKLQGVIEFEEGQRDQVYKVLADGAESELSSDDERFDPTTAFTEGMGIDMDPYGLGLQKAVMESVGDPSKLAEAGADQKEMAKNMRAAFDKRIDAKVEALRPVLNDKQLEQYRSELKTKGLGVYGTMLMGLDPAPAESN